MMKRDPDMPALRPRVSKSFIRMARSIYDGDDWNADTYQRVPMMYYWPYYAADPVSF